MLGPPIGKIRAAAEQVGELGAAGLGQFQISAVALHIAATSR
jgi:hypothetical protein